MPARPRLHSVGPAPERRPPMANLPPSASPDENVAGAASIAAPIAAPRGRVFAPAIGERAASHPAAISAGWANFAWRDPAGLAGPLAFAPISLQKNQWLSSDRQFGARLARTRLRAKRSQDQNGLITPQKGDDKMSVLNSVNTNTGAAIALNNLNTINRELATTQNRIATGLEVATARDNGAIFAIAQNQRAEVQAFDAVTRNLDRGSAAVDVSLAGGEQLGTLLNDLREVALEATDVSLTADARANLEASVDNLVGQINSFVNNSEFNGINLLSGGTLTARTGTGATDTFTIGAGAAGAGIDFRLQATAAGAIAGGLAFGQDTATVSGADAAAGAAAAATFLGQIETSITNLNQGLGNLGAAGNRIDSQIAFNETLVASLNAGIGSLVDADLAQESASLTALQTQQQLGLAAFGIANSSASAILGFF